MPDFAARAIYDPTLLLSTLLQTASAILWPYTAPSAGGVWPAVNRAIYCPILVEDPVTVKQLVVWPTVQSGNFDIGIYTETGKRVISKGSTAVGAANTMQPVDITDTPLTPGFYYLGMSCDNTTAAFQRSNNGDADMMTVFGVQNQALGAVTLPDPWVPINAQNAYVPLIQGLCMSSVI